MCFIDNLNIKTKYIGDTVEITVRTIFKNDSLCSPYGSGGALTIFGFFPNIDTVAYRSDEIYNIRKRVVEKYKYENKWEWAGFHPRAKQKKEFKEFIIKNKSKLNKWLKQEAIRRGYITKD